MWRSRTGDVLKGFFDDPVGSNLIIADTSTGSFKKIKTWNDVTKKNVLYLDDAKTQKANQ